MSSDTRIHPLTNNNSTLKPPSTLTQVLTSLAYDGPRQGPQRNNLLAFILLHLCTHFCWRTVSSNNLHPFHISHHTISLHCSQCVIVMTAISTIGFDRFGQIYTHSFLSKPSFPEVEFPDNLFLIVSCHSQIIYI